MTTLAQTPEPFRVYLDRAGAALSEAEWIALRTDPAYVQIQWTSGPGWSVATTWEGVVRDRLDDPLPFRVSVRLAAVDAPRVSVDCATEAVAAEVHAAEVARLQAIRE
jgi:hypothetical protein